MKKIALFIFGISMVFTLSGCTIDRDDSKDKRIEELNSEIITLTSKVENQNFERNLKCQWLLDWLKRKYNNIFSIFYDEYGNTCYIKYYDKKNNNKFAVSPIDDFWLIK